MMGGARCARAHVCLPALANVLHELGQRLPAEAAAQRAEAAAGNGGHREAGEAETLRRDAEAACAHHLVEFMWMWPFSDITSW